MANYDYTTAGFPRVTPAQQRKNRMVLADYLEERVTDAQFDMSNFCNGVPIGNECATVGCALGWAALSGLIPGLSWNRPYKDSPTMEPVVAGKFRAWDDVGPHFFGYKAWSDVFINPKLIDGSASRAEVARLLRRIY